MPVRLNLRHFRTLLRTCFWVQYFLLFTHASENTVAVTHPTISWINYMNAYNVLWNSTTCALVVTVIFNLTIMNIIFTFYPLGTFVHSLNIPYGTKV